jgi:hypothetical protein
MLEGVLYVVIIVLYGVNAMINWHLPTYCNNVLYENLITAINSLKNINQLVLGAAKSRVVPMLATAYEYFVCHYTACP